MVHDQRDGLCELTKRWGPGQASTNLLWAHSTHHKATTNEGTEGRKEGIVSLLRSHTHVPSSRKTFNS